MQSSKVLKPTETEKVLDGISIPPRPTILTDIHNELQRPTPDLTLIAHRIAADVGLSGTILKVVNSSYYGLPTKMGSVLQAVKTLGVINIKSIVTGLVLRSAISGGKVSLERFWDGAEKVAHICAYIAAMLPIAHRDEAYSLGLFRDEAYSFGLLRDCAIPLLMKRFPSYRDTLMIPPSESCTLTDIEDAHLGTNHAIVGQILAHHWGLPETITSAISRHHDITVFAPSDPLSPISKNLIAINYLAEHLHESVLRMRDDPQWNSVGMLVLRHLGWDDTNLRELKDDIELAIA